MPRDPRFDILFEPIAIGPVVARNRFYQVPHCSGMGYLLPETQAAMRGIKAEGGWGVVNTEYCSIHPTSDDTPYPSVTNWDDGDVAALAIMADQVHRHGALAGIELWHGGSRVNNTLSREAPLGVASLPPSSNYPVQSLAMDKDDIRAFRRWHVDAARRARQAGFDIVYVYAAHGYLLDQFLSPDHNRRGDEYGGSLENRVRLLREILSDTKEAIGADCAIALRLAADDGGFVGVETGRSGRDRRRGNKPSGTTRVARQHQLQRPARGPPTTRHSGRRRHRARSGAFERSACRCDAGIQFRQQRPARSEVRSNPGRARLATGQPLAS